MKSIFSGIGLFSFLLAVSLAEITSIDYPARMRRVLAKASDDRPALDTLELPQLLQVNLFYYEHIQCLMLLFNRCVCITDTMLRPCLNSPLASPFVTPGSKICPCRVGLTCSTRKRRCVYITPDPDEVEESLLRDNSEGN
ncbi:unnamed protein product [Porites evermanni]|uniref:Uncharacterized protein n=1 Tax=Porites evermanni TaxID=104178 RepID=A0ABN8S1F5_9CNID|nr:unnamed protein product [Porites evermanni]